MVPLCCCYSFFVVLLVALIDICNMPHCHSAGPKQVRNQRAIDKGFIKGRPVETQHVLVPNKLAGRVKQMADSLTLHVGHCEILSTDAPPHFARDATLAVTQRKTQAKRLKFTGARTLPNIMFAVPQLLAAGLAHALLMNMNATKLVNQLGKAKGKDQRLRKAIQRKVMLVVLMLVVLMMNPAVLRFQAPSAVVSEVHVAVRTFRMPMIPAIQLTHSKAARNRLRFLTPSRDLRTKTDLVSHPMSLHALLTSARDVRVM